MYSHVNGDECPSFDGDPTHVDPSLGISVTRPPISVYSRPVSSSAHRSYLHLSRTSLKLRFRYVATFPKGTNAILPTITEPPLISFRRVYTRTIRLASTLVLIFSFFFRFITSRAKEKRKEKIQYSPSISEGAQSRLRLY